MKILLRGWLSWEQINVLKVADKSMAFEQNCIASIGACLWIWIAINLLHLSTSVSATHLKSFNLTDGRSLVLERIHQHLRTLNKSAIKSIQSSDGDTIDCVPIRMQLAFDHPKLRNHQIQKAPFAWPKQGENAAKRGSFKSIQQLWHQHGHCPKGTIPVRRTKAEDIMRAGSIQLYGRKFQSPPKPNSVERPEPLDGEGHEHAIAYVSENQFYGAQASINVWQPSVEVPNEFSLSQMWLLAGSFNGDLNSIEAGWQVSPELYGDSNPRLFTYWTTDEYQSTGCYNLLCSGFIQLNNEVAIGASISPVSSYEGSQFDIQVLIWKDPRTGNWWMRLGDEFLVGYWPEEIFSHLTGAANMIEWGGEVVNTEPFGQHTSTQMGSGLFPAQGFAQASYFRNLGYVDATNQLVTQFDMYTLAECPNCYAIEHSYSDDWGNFFYYGGPGQNPNCH
ncbi:hypothetical protein O6H91_10G079900 [Diphasiastrum complanatum]|uniref:Uncharacterized protein n=1 Tax=Diphasiastrum complanatum TaxID=34168 RepID=A0ACC2CIN7_DIPCM|nr:hypothetical protein O6H91_10G079900 [Diphasiastrum complanatum]